jgi:hypothetical protein
MFCDIIRVYGSRFCTLACEYALWRIMVYVVSFGTNAFPHVVILPLFPATSITCFSTTTITHHYLLQIYSGAWPPLHWSESEGLILHMHIPHKKVCHL